MCAQGFGCEVLAHDLYPNQRCIDMGVKYVSLDELLDRADAISLHCPLTPDTFHLINKERYVYATDKNVERLKQRAILCMLCLNLNRMHATEDGHRMRV